MLITLNFLTIIKFQHIPFNNDLQFRESQEVLVATPNPEMKAPSFSKIPKIALKQDNGHALIYIDGNANFTSTATGRGWPGDGSKFNPYLIEGLNFTSLASSYLKVDEGIIIVKNTNVYFQINNCFLNRNAFSNGILLKNVSQGCILRNTIKNMLSDETYFWPNPGIAIHLEETKNVTITENNIFNDDIFYNCGGGILIENSQDNSIMDNICINGLMLKNAPDNMISRNNFSDSGITLFRSPNNNIMHNTFLKSGISFMTNDCDEPCEQEYYRQMEVTNNTINSKPLIYWQDRTGETVPSEAGQVILMNCTSITVTNQNLTTKMIVAFSTSSFIQNNIIARISLICSDDSTISNNSISNGISLWNSRNNLMLSNLIESRYQSIEDNFYYYHTLGKFANNTISDNIIYGDILFLGSSNSSILRNTIISSGWVFEEGYIPHNMTLRLYETNSNLISGNTISGMLELSITENCKIQGNIVSDGIKLSRSVNNRILDNIIIKDGLWMQGGYPQAEVTNNTVNDKPLIYWEDKTGGTVPSGSGQVILVNCSSVTVTGQDLSNIYHGLILADCSNLLIQENLLNNTYNGIYLENTRNCTISDNIISNNRYGIEVIYTNQLFILNNIISNNYEGITISTFRVSSFRDFNNNIFISGNIISNNSCNGIYILNTNQLFIENNTINANKRYGIFFCGSDHWNENILISSNSISNNGRYGIAIGYISLIIITNNTIIDNKGGTSLGRGKDGMILQNLFMNNSGFGLSLGANTYAITIKRNNFIGNSLDLEPYSAQACDESSEGSKNVFTFNYWSDWTGPDKNKDGFVDSPYLIPTTNQDSYPLTSPNPLILAHILLPPKIIFPNGGEVLNETITVSWTAAVDSLGHSITYSVYYSSDGGNAWVLLASNISGTAYVWNTSSLSVGTYYMIKVVAKCSEGLMREDTSDSTFTLLNIYITTSSNFPSTTTSQPGSTPGFTFLIIFATITLIAITIKRYHK